MNFSALAAAALLASMPLMAEEPVLAEETEEELQELETIVIVGGYSLPRMWKVSKGGQVMWVLGNTGPAPPGIKWHSEQLEARLAQSQLVLYPGWVNTGVDISIFKMVTLLPAAFKAAKNPDGKTLKEVLPPETYARWRVLKTTYVGRDNDIEKWRPSIAIEKLEDKIWDKIGPAQPKNKPPPMGPSLRSVVDKAAKAHKVKVRTMPTVKREVQVKNARAILKSARESDIGDAKCFTQTLDYLENLVAYVELRKLDALPQGAEVPRPVDCEDFLVKGLRSGEIPDPAGALKVLDELALQSALGRKQLDAEWMAAAQAAMAKNKSTFALLPMRQTTGPDSYFARLRELGYDIEELKDL